MTNRAMPLATWADEDIEKILDDIIKNLPRAKILYVEQDLFERACAMLWDGSLPSYFVYCQREFRPKEV